MEQGNSEQTPEVSVVVPAYNTAAFLGQCLESILAQSFKDFEVIIIDDGSTDNTLQVARDFEKRDPRVKVYRQDNQGLSGARNSGIEKSRGRWITGVDSDDLIHPDFLQVLHHLVTTTGAEVACCNFSNFYPKSSPLDFKNSKGKVEVLAPRDALVKALYQRNIPNHSFWNKLYARSLLQKHKHTPHIYFEDLQLVPFILADSKKIVATSAPLYFYRIHGSSILNTPYNAKKAGDLLSVAEFVYEQFKSGDRATQRAAANILTSCSCSILMRTSAAPEFSFYRERAWNHLKALRWQILFNVHTRIKNKFAAMLSLLGKSLFAKAARRFG